MATTIATPLPSLPTHHPHHNFSSITLNNDRYFKYHPTLSLIERCSDTQTLKQIHAHMLRNGLFFDPFSASKFMHKSALSPFSSLEYARKVFDQIPQPNLHTWSTIIRAYASSPQPIQSLIVFIQMLYQSNDAPDKFTFPFVIKAAAELSASRVGRVLQGMVIKLSLGSDVYILNSLIYFYAACGCLDMAHRVFVSMPSRDVVSWNSMISAFTQGDYLDEALDLFRGMEMENVKPNTVTMVGVVSACAKKLDLEFGRWVHSYIERNEIGYNLILSNALLDMYTKCGSIKDAELLFDKIGKKDIVSWTTMIVGYAKSGNYVAARGIFGIMPSQDIAAWNALISTYEQMGNPVEALAIFRELQLSAKAKPDVVTLVSTLSACSQVGALDLGRWIHKYIKNEGIELTCHLGTSLIDLYSKCGELSKAIDVFNSIQKKDVFIWSAMIAGYAMHGRGSDAIQLFVEMQDLVKPNAITFTNLLCACSHSGLVNEGRTFFNQMKPVYGILPGAQHYSCMVDMLGRAGHLEEAEELIKNMPIPPTVSVWGAFLSACRLQDEVELAEKACEELLKLDPNNDGAFVLLSNTYSRLGRSTEVASIRKLMRDKGLKKEPGCSSIEVNGKIHEFIVADTSHNSSKMIYQKLDEVLGNCKSTGYTSHITESLHIVEEEELKEQTLRVHSEKLAIAFGLISVEPSQPIRIMKNLRVCRDCHSVAKIVSKIYDREIMLRDRYRFHHFKGGECSCMDYW